MFIDLASLIRDIHCPIFRGVPLHKMARKSGIEFRFLIRIKCRAVDCMGFLSICINEAENCPTLL